MTNTKDVTHEYRKWAVFHISEFSTFHYEFNSYEEALVYAQEEAKEAYNAHITHVIAEVKSAWRYD